MYHWYVRTAVVSKSVTLSLITTLTRKQKCELGLQLYECEAVHACMHVHKQKQASASEIVDRRAGVDDWVCTHPQQIDYTSSTAVRVLVHKITAPWYPRGYQWYHIQNTRVRASYFSRPTTDIFCWAHRHTHRHEGSLVPSSGEGGLREGPL
jgi:hypothetical protein